MDLSRFKAHGGLRRSVGLCTTIIGKRIQEVLRRSGSQGDDAVINADLLPVRIEIRLTATLILKNNRHWRSVQHLRNAVEAVLVSQYSTEEGCLACPDASTTLRGLVGRGTYHSPIKTTSRQIERTCRACPQEAASQRSAGAVEAPAAASVSARESQVDRAKRKDPRGRFSIYLSK